MTQLEHDKVFKITTVSIKDFADSLKVTKPSIYYALKNDMIDYIEIGDRQLVVLTAKTRQYKPNESPKRSKPKKKKR